MIKYLLIAGLVYVVYRYFNLTDKIQAGQTKPKIEPKERGAGDAEDFVDYEEIDD